MMSLSGRPLWLRLILFTITSTLLLPEKVFHVAYCLLMPWRIVRIRTNRIIFFLNMFYVGDILLLSSSYSEKYFQGRATNELLGRKITLWFMSIGTDWDKVSQAVADIKKKHYNVHGSISTWMNADCSWLE